MGKPNCCESVEGAESSDRVFAHFHVVDGEQVGQVFGYFWDDFRVGLACGDYEMESVGNSDLGRPIVT